MLSNNYQPTYALGNGVTVDFTFPWNAILAAAVVVYLRDVTTGVDTLQVVNTDYTLVLGTAGGTVTFLTPPTSDQAVIIAREVEAEQPTPYRTVRGFDGQSIEQSYDLLTAKVQQVEERLARVPEFPIASGQTGTTLPVLTGGAGKALKVNAGEDGFELSDVDVDQAVAEAAASAAAALDSENAAAASEIDAENAAIAAAASAASINLPALAGGAFSYLRVKGDETGYDLVTAKTIVDQSLQNVGELTIASGEVTFTGLQHYIDTEGDAAIDDLVTANGGTNGMVVKILAANAGRPFILKNTGNIVTPDGEDMLVTSTHGAELLWDATASKWYVMNRAARPSQVVAEEGADNYTSMTPLRTLQARAGNVLILRDEKVSGTDGGQFLSGSWHTRTLNTEVINTISGASLLSNQFTLPAGSYRIKARAPSAQIGSNKAKLYNVTDASDVVIGSSACNRNETGIYSDSWVIGEFTIAATKTFEIQHRCVGGSTGVGGFGLSSGFSVIEVYTEVFIEKIG